MNNKSLTQLYYRDIPLCCKNCDNLDYRCNHSTEYNIKYDCLLNLFLPIKKQTCNRKNQVYTKIFSTEK